MPFRKKDDIFEGIPLAPHGQPELLCRTCGGPKPPKQKCFNCWVTGRRYRGAEITDESVRLKIANRRKELIKRYRKQFHARHPKKLNRWRATKRGYQVTQLDRLLDLLFKCFERDDQGEWNLYADRMGGASEVLDEIEILLPLIRKALKYSVGKQLPPGGD